MWWLCRGFTSITGIRFILAFRSTRDTIFHHFYMNDAETFYPGLHAKDANYSAGEYHMESLFGLQAIGTWAEKYSQRPLRMLDVGCGKGVFLCDFATGIRKRWGVQTIKGTGIDLVRSPGDQFDRI